MADNRRQTELVDLALVKRAYLSDRRHTVNGWYAFFRRVKRHGAILAVYRDGVEQAGHLWTR